MQKEGNVSWGVSHLHSWAVWCTKWGSWRWQVSANLNDWMTVEHATSEEAAFEAARRTLVDRGDSMQ